MFCRTIKNYGLFILLNLLVIPAFAESEPQKSPEAKAEAKQASPHIARSSFTSAIQNREPVDQLTILSQLIGEAFFFTEIKNYQGHTLTHQWSLNGIISHSVPFTVTGKRWRVYSSKAFKQGAKQEGTWLVKVLDTDGSTIKESRIDYLRPSTPAEMESGQRTAQAAAEKSTQNTSAGKLPVESRYTNVVSEVTTADVKANEDEAKDNNEPKKAQTSTETATETKNTTSDKTADKPEKSSVNNSVKSDSASKENTEEKDTLSDTETSNKEENADDSASKKPVWDKM